MSQTSEINQNTKIFHFNEAVIKKIQKDKLNMEQVFILECIYKGDASLLNTYSDNFESERAAGLLIGLVRKDFVHYKHESQEYILTIDGHEYYDFLVGLANGNRAGGLKVIGIAKGIRKEGFEEWWALYPANSKWEDKNTGTKFSEIRPLRTGKEQCKKKYDNLINNRHVTHRELIDCLKYEIKARKIDSLKNNKNQLCFMKNSLSYLNQEAYLSYIDEVKNNPGYIQDCDVCDMNDLDISHDDIYDSNTELGN